MMPVVVAVRRSRGGSVQSRRSIGGTIRRWSGAPIIGSSWSGRRRRRRRGWRGANPRLGGMVGVEVVPWQQPLRVPLLVVPLPPPVVLPPLPIWPICPVPSGLMRNPAMPYPRWYWSFGRSERPNGRRRGRRRQGRRPPPGPPRLPRAGPPPVAVRRKKVGRRVVVEVVGARRRRRRRRRKGVRNHRRHRRRRRRLLLAKLLLRALFCSVGTAGAVVAGVEAQFRLPQEVVGEDGGGRRRRRWGMCHGLECFESFTSI
mmetsp:Transcript_31848/g.64836  ORF Transcript_31848/g.64836 Transcript_31848/m.64836 type:complete len:258 (+) Transcript_31848:488-1261(+)